MKCQPARIETREVFLVALMLAGLLTGGGPALSAQKKKAPQTPVEYGMLSGAPVLAVISLKEQRIAVYDGAGGSMGARISSGNAGNETPAGIFSLLQKNRDHVSNVFDVPMPFMQRITWTGVAMHEGVLPGYPASHGCIRMPRKFAERLFPMTRIGMRVVVARDNVAPVEIAHRNLLQPRPQSLVAQKTAFVTRSHGEDGPPAFFPDLTRWPQRQAEFEALRTEAGLKATEAEEAKKPLAKLASVAAAKSKLRAAAVRKVQQAETASKAAERAASRAEKDLAAASDPARLKPLEAAKAKAAAAVERAAGVLAEKTAQAAAATDERTRTQAQLAVRRAQAAKRTADKQLSAANSTLERAASPARYRPQQEAAGRSRKAQFAAMQALEAAKAALGAAEIALAQADADAAAATAAAKAAEDAAKTAEGNTLPVSMFVSRKTQRLYVRQGHEPVLDMPVTIAEADRAIGNYVFTAGDFDDGGESLRWTAVSLNRSAATRPGEIASAKQRHAMPVDAPAPLTDANLATAALERISLPADIMERFRSAAWPGSSLIISDEGPSRETGVATDFVVLISDEPKGGLKATKRETVVRKPVYTTNFGIFSAGSSSAAPKTKVKPGKSLFGFW